MRFSYCYISLFLLIIGLDQASKSFLINYLKTLPGLLLPVTSFFNLVYCWNYGISFGLFSQYYQYSNYLFILLNSIILSSLLIAFNKSTKALEKFGYIVITAGALSNIIDRLLRGKVFDFISISYSDYYFPVFNLADMAICIGVGVLLLATYILRNN